MSRRWLILAALLPMVAFGLRGSSPARHVAVSRLVPTSGPFSFTAAANNSGTGTQDWTIVSAGGTNALPNLTVSHYLFLTSATGVSIPAGSTINSIQIDIVRSASINNVSTAYIQDSSIKLVKAGSVVGSDLADLATRWPTSLTTATYGPSLWGATWASTDFGAGQGVAIAAIEGKSGGGTDTATVDHAQETIIYTAGVPAVRRRVVIMLS